MRKPQYWNHNVAYFQWIKGEIAACTEILDVGCGGGSLLAFLDDSSKRLTGLDLDEGRQKIARARNVSNNM